MTDKEFAGSTTPRIAADQLHAFVRAIWEQAGEMSLPPGRELDWQLLVGIVRELYGPEQSAQDASQ